MSDDLADMSRERLDLLEQAVTRDTESGLYYGANIKIARHGETVLDLAVGYADADRTRKIQADSVFSIFSISKAFINTLTLRAIEQGRFALTTKMVDLIPEFAGPPRDRATIFNFLTHSTGMPGVWEPAPGLDLEALDDSVPAVLKYIQGVVEPGSRCDYAPMANHALLAEVLRRTDPQKRDIRTILQEDLWDPLGMTDTSLGIRADLRDRHVVPDMRGTVPIKSPSKISPGDYGLFTAEYNEVTWAGGASTTADLQKLAEMLRLEGIGATGNRILSPAMVRAARKNWTGDMPNELYKTVALRAGYTPPPAYLGLGWNVRGTGIVNTQLGTLTSPETMGNYGSGSALYWVDPELDLTFVALTAGVMTQAANIGRFQRLSDMVVASAI
jgi:CubicO group peptidase (beta-lactamase class C family)